MVAFLRDIATPNVLTKVVSQTAATDELILNIFGMEPGGPNELSLGHGRVGAFHVFNETRVPAQGRAPGVAAGRSSLQNAGRVAFEYPRMHEMLQIPLEYFSNIGKLDDPTQRDRAALDMIGRQSAYLRRKARNWRTAMVIGMLRGTVYMVQSGDTWYPSYTNVSGSVPYAIGSMPAGNQNQLAINGGSGLIDSGWQNPSADGPYQIGAISAAYQELHGFPLAMVILNWKTFSYLLKMDAVVDLAGMANKPYDNFGREVGKGPDGRPLLAYHAEFGWAPGIRFVVTDAGLKMGAPGAETFVKHIPDDYAAFTADPLATDVYSGYLGSEPIAEHDGGPIDTKIGLSSWHTSTANPTAENLFALDNFLPVNHVPGTLSYAKVANF